MIEPNRRKTTLRERFNISRLAIAHPWLTLSFWMAVIVAGLLAFSSLKYALFPDITFPVVIVNATAPFTDTLETEAKLTQPIEQSLSSIPRVGGSRSSTYPNQTVISVSFPVGSNLEESSRQVETKLGQLTLPQGSTYKVIPLNLNESAAVSYVIESSSKNLAELTAIAQQQIVPSIAKVPGVLKVTLLGATESTEGQRGRGAEGESGRVGEGERGRVGEGESGRGAEGQDTLVRFNGENVLAFQVIKKGDANTLEVVSKVEKKVANLQSALPEVQLILAATQAEYIRSATQATIDALLEAVLLSVIVIFPFLWNWRATFISALAIPTSLLGTFIVMAIYGFNLETITLLALALVIGSVIDDAIVDVENIMRHIDEGENPRQAAIHATNEVGLTVVASTLTAVAVFLPIALMSGTIGQFFKPFGITVSAAMLTSMLVARTLSPVLAVFWLKPKPSKFAAKANHSWSHFAQSYRNLLNWSLKHRTIVIALAVASFMAGIGLIPLIPKGFIPKLDRGEFNITYRTPISATAYLPEWLKSSAGVETDPLKESLDVAKQLEEVVLKSPEVQTVFTVVGSRQGEANRGTIYVELKSDRKLHTAEVQDRIRQQLPNLPGVTTSVEDIQFVETGGGAQKPLQLTLVGDDIQALSNAVKKIEARIQKIPGFVDVTIAGETNEDGNVFEIEHRNRKRAAYISANLSQDLTIGKATDIIVAEANRVLPPGISLDLGGDSARSNEVFTSFGTTLSLSAVCILFVLIFLFKSWIDPLVICLSLPLGLVGAMVALLVTKSDFGMISLIGFVFLLGLANKNAILLVDYINQLRKSGLDRTEAILRAGPVRLRPIVMTTASTILGMIPLALGLGAGSEVRSPMAIAIAGGLVTSTLLSLIVVPVVYDILDDLRSPKRF
ncbi:efflux RND transporter permease subunit [Argonema antarcticum]|uniref:efflux RND transporter permease subunit n=1 Tax=Argonema antarcticum TaxID=2942763 RepID=UPI002011C842|nr:efflux RND transporter permease subunit [Argonema antarcticum]MCL1475058.1 efflux RND transporter permease subunit [Argonema antarcticum A004/B2]